MKSISTEVIIDANIEKVWKILSDFPAYPEWNPSKPWRKLPGTVFRSPIKNDWRRHPGKF